MTDITIYQHKTYERLSVGLCIVTLIEAVTPGTHQIWGAQVNNTFIGWTGSRDGALAIAKANVPTGKTDKGELVKALNAARSMYGIPELDAIAIKKMHVTKAVLDNMLHDMATLASHGPVAKPQTPMPELMARLNAVRKRHGMKPISTKGKGESTRTSVLEAIDKLQHMTPPGVEVTKLKAVIADGANTSRYHTKMHTNKYDKAVKRMDKKETRDKLKSQRALADTLAKANGFTRTNVIRWLQIKMFYDASKITEGWQEEFKKFIEDRHVALKGTKPKAAKTSSPKPRAGGDHLTPSELASITGKEPRAVRIMLRKREKELKPAWRDTKAGRWAFIKAHKDAIVKFINGGPK